MVSSHASLKAGAKSDGENYVGASIFLIYIAAALLLTFAIVRHLHWKYWQMPQATRSSSIIISRLRVFIPLAILSFALLSFNMLSFLIVSFHSFTMARKSFVGSDFDPSLATHVWRWVTSSELFVEFATQLVSSADCIWWARRALRGHLLTFMYMGSLSREDNVSQQVFWSLCALAQILPVSFALNLLFLYLVMHKVPWRTKSSGDGSLKGLVLLFWKLGAGTFLAFEGLSIFLDIVEMSSNGEQLITCVLAVRLLLAASVQLPYDPIGLEAYFVSSTLYSLYDKDVPNMTFWLFREGSTLFAVRSLGIDHLLLIVSLATWVAFGPSHLRGAFEGKKEEIQGYNIDFKVMAKSRRGEAFGEVFRGSLNEAGMFARTDLSQLSSQQTTELLRVVLDRCPEKLPEKAD